MTGKFFIVYFYSFLACINGFAYELTITVEPGYMECFYQSFQKLGVLAEFEYQVLDGSGMDINFYVKGPDSFVIRTDQRKRSNHHEIKVTQAGTYEFCFDNRYSMMNSKMVYFDIYCEADDPTFPNSDLISQEIAIQSRQLMAAHEAMELSSEQIRDSLQNVKHSVEKIMAIQGVLSAQMTKDRSTQEDNFSRVNHFSGLYMFVIVSVSVVQVLMIRNFFNAPGGNKAMKTVT